VEVTATAADGRAITFKVKCRVDSSIEAEYFAHGGILPFVLKQAMTT